MKHTLLLSFLVLAPILVAQGAQGQPAPRRPRGIYAVVRVENYVDQPAASAAPSSVVQDPTMPAGNLIMIYHAEQHCPGGVWQSPSYATVGFAGSSDNGKSWPEPEIGVPGGHYPVLESAEPQPTVPHPSLGDAAPSASGDYYLYVAYTYFSSSGEALRVARAKLGADPLTFLKWYNGSFSQPGIGGLDSAVMPSTGRSH